MQTVPVAMTVKLPLRPNQPVFLFRGIIGKTGNLLIIMARSKKALRVYSSVLIQGQSGTGRKMIVRAIHAESGRKGLFVPKLLPPIGDHVVVHAPLLGGAVEEFDIFIPQHLSEHEPP